MRTPFLLLIAAGIGVGTVSTMVIILTLAARRPLDLTDEWPILGIQAIFVAIPFLLLALLGVRDIKPWLTGILLTAALWGYYLYDAFIHSGRGVNFAVVALMMLSPVLVAAACLAASYKYLRRRAG